MMYESLINGLFGDASTRPRRSYSQPLSLIRRGRTCRLRLHKWYLLSPEVCKEYDELLQIQVWVQNNFTQERSEAPILYNK